MTPESTRKTTQKLTKRAQKGSKQSVLPIINSSFWLFVAETVHSERNWSLLYVNNHVSNCRFVLGWVGVGKIC